VLDAAIELFAARGLEGASMEAIAEASGVSKATIYKHWPDKDALCLEVVVRLNGIDHERPAFDSGDLRADLIDLLRYKPPEQATNLRDRLMPHLMGYAARNRKFGTAWRSRVVEPQRAEIAALLRRGVNQGLFAPSLDVSLATALLLGPVIYSKVFGADPGRHEDLSEGTVDAFWRAFARQAGGDLPAHCARVEPRLQHSGS
jgi:AcrR family transcriptional regulator